MFEIGQQVVCIDDTWIPTSPGPLPADLNLPVKGQVYTVQRIVIWKYEWLILRETSQAVWFIATHFRPVRKTSIEDLQKLLVTPPKVKELV